MKKKLVNINTLNNYDVFVGNNEQLYAVTKEEAKKLYELQSQARIRKYDIEENQTIACYKLSKIGTIKMNPQFDNYTIVDDTPIEVKINSLNSFLVSFLP